MRVCGLQTSQWGRGGWPDIILQILFVCLQCELRPSVCGIPETWRMGKNESGQIVFEKVKWAYSDEYLSQTMWNNAKNLMKMLKRAKSLFLQCEISSAVLKTWITNETKTRITQNFQILYPIQGGYHLKAYAPRILKMWYFLGLAVFKVELLAIKVRSNSKKKSRIKKRSQKKDTATILIFQLWNE